MNQFDPNRPGEIAGDVTSVLVIDPVKPTPPNVGNFVVEREQAAGG